MMVKSVLLLALIAAYYGGEASENEGYGYGYRQCSCAEQKACFEELKTETRKCFQHAQVALDQELKKENADPTKANVCYVKFTDYVADWISCVDAKLTIESSCLATKSEQKIKSADFLTIYTKIAMERINKRMNHLYGLDKHKLVQMEKKWHNSAKECAFEKATKISCFMKENCVLNGAEKVVKKVVKQCYKEHDVVKVHHNRCECLTDKVPGYGYGLASYCAKVKATTFSDDE